MLKMICFDMDGTIADLYKVLNWLRYLLNFDPYPYRQANPMWDMKELASVLNQLRSSGIEVRIITWLAKGSTPEYDREVRQAKKEWLKEQGFPFDHFHCVSYGATKADSVRKYLAEGETAILIDDNATVRQGWHLGDTIDPTACNIIEALRKLL